MGIGTGVRYFGSAALLIASIFLIIASISAPTVKQIYLLRVDLGSARDTQINFGVFGWCGDGNNRDVSGCSDAVIGYNPAKLIRGVTDIDISRTADRAARSLSHGFILHPIAAVLSFICFLLSLKTGFFSIITLILCSLNFIVTIVAVAFDFAAFTLLKDQVNKSRRDRAEYGAAIWLVLVAAVLTLVGTIIVFVTCCAGRRKKRYENRKVGY